MLKRIIIVLFLFGIGFGLLYCAPLPTCWDDQDCPFSRCSNGICFDQYQKIAGEDDAGDGRPDKTGPPTDNPKIPDHVRNKPTDKKGKKP